MKNATMWLMMSVAICGCSRRISESELGQIHYDVPPIPAGVEAYRLPDLSPDQPTPVEQTEQEDAPSDSPTPATLPERTQQSPLSSPGADGQAP